MADLDCGLCGEPLLPTQLRAQTNIPAHVECMFSNVAGHLVGACGCTMPDATVREIALAAWDRKAALGAPDDETSKRA